MSSTMTRAIPVEAGTELEGILHTPEAPRGIVLFVHGSGSSRLSPRNTFVADRLAAHGLATLLFDLLTAQEEEIDAVTAELRFDIPLLTERLIAVTDWTLGEADLEDLSIGYFGASTGAAAALAAAARVPEVGAVVSRGGRPDLAGPALRTVQAPTLLIVGGNDREVLALNRAALAQLTCEATLTIVPGATHLFVEPGALERVAALAADWFEHHLEASRPTSVNRSA
jgi:dienelactone hydrolase